MRPTSLLLFLPLACAAPAADEPADPAGAALELGAETDPARAFDFWLGDWQCHGPDGSLGGHNTITLEAGGRALQEHWVGAGGGVGTSLSFLDAGTGTWHQTWIDNSGGTLYLDGGPDETGAMVLEGTKERRDGGGLVRHRVVWTPDANAGTVRQHWTWTIDDGATWGTAADLVYSRVR
mgnify:CR=1 FL=1